MHACSRVLRYQVLSNEEEEDEPTNRDFIDELMDSYCPPPLHPPAGPPHAPPKDDMTTASPLLLRIGHFI